MYSQYILCNSKEVAEKWQRHEIAAQELHAELQPVKNPIAWKSLAKGIYERGESFVFIYPDNQVHLLMSMQVNTWKDFAALAKREIRLGMADYLLFHLKFYPRVNYKDDRAEDTSGFTTYIYVADLSLDQIDL